jgi:acyl-CoA hydrolase
LRSPRDALLLMNQPAPKPSRISHVEMTEIILPPDANAYGTAFGGRIMQWVDIAAAVAAKRHAGGVAVDEHGHPRVVPEVVPENPEEERRYREADERRRVRLSRRAPTGETATVSS